MGKRELEYGRIRGRLCLPDFFLKFFKDGSITDNLY